MRQTTRREPTREKDPLWYKDAVIYELHVKTYADSNGDGIGDFKGLTGKLDYLQDLGVTALWLLPFYPSPLKDDGYDISDYTSVHPDYGALRDFRRFLAEAHKRNLRVITELVLNHTSDQHPWFHRARRAKAGSQWRNFYVWSDTPDRYPETRIIFQDFESSNWAWDPIAKSYYWHRFYSHQPDLNYDNPRVQDAMFRSINFWFDLGVDGLRLDAVPYLYERENTNCENLPETYAFLQRLRSHVESRFEDRMLLGEANQWPEDAASYFGRGDMCHMAFHFPLMPRLFMALRMEDSFPVLDIMEQTPEIPDSCQWAIFLRNHDELTLEMVTDEERDYMHRAYAQDPQMRLNLGIRRRLAPLLGNHRRRMELMTALLFSLPGAPVVYYGDEIGMGDNIYLGDRNGVRTPMQWSADRNAGFSRANAQRLYLPVIIDPEYHYESVNVEAQQNNPHSLLWWTKRVIGLRKRFPAFSRGTLSFLHPENRKILAFLREHPEGTILVVANLSRFVQYVELDLQSFRGMIPVEMFGGTSFPQIQDGPLFLSLGPHSFYWFGLVAPTPQDETVEISGSRPPVLRVRATWEEIAAGKPKAELEKILAGYLPAQRWFAGKARAIKGVRILDLLAVNRSRHPALFLIVQVDYLEGDPDRYHVPLAYASGESADAVVRDHIGAVVAFVEQSGPETGILYDATLDARFCRALLDAIRRRSSWKARGAEITTTTTPALRSLWTDERGALAPTLLRKEQSNTSVAYGDRLLLKMFRRLPPGTNPDLEIGTFLTRRGFAHIPPVAGGIEYRRGKEPVTLAILEGYVRNQGDAWTYTLDMLSNYFEQIITQRPDPDAHPLPQIDALSLDGTLPENISQTLGGYTETAQLLGQRTAALHRSLFDAKGDPAFEPEPFSKLYQRALYQSLRTLTRQALGLLHNRLGTVPEELVPAAEHVLREGNRIMDFFWSVTREKLTAVRMRCHGDYHLGQVLYTGKDFVIMDFEGEPARPISERRIKRSPLRDVAGMVRSFHYAASTGLVSLRERGLVPDDDLPVMEFWAAFWHNWISAVFLSAYRKTSEGGGFLPHSLDELRFLLDIYLLEKAVYELSYELNNRPAWVKIPLDGIQQLLAGLPEES